MNKEDLKHIEQRRLELQVAIDQRRSLQDRNRLGQFATPTALAIDIANAAQRELPNDQSSIHFGEPAVGSGAFFSALLQAFPADCISSATGVEIDPVFATTACDLWGSHGLKVIEGDFMDSRGLLSALPRPTLILTNPPYVRHHHLNAEQKKRLGERAGSITGIKVNGLAGLYVYFMLIAHDWLADGGFATWLIPSEFMDVNYGTALKTYLTQKVTLASIHRFDPSDVQFDDALVSSAVVSFRKTPPTPQSKARFTYGGTVTAPLYSQQIPFVDLQCARKWTVYPQGPEVQRTGKCVSTSLTLGDLFHIRRGIATGANDYFILSRAEAKHLELPENYLKPILPSPRYLHDVIIEREADGFPAIAPQSVVIDCDLSEPEIERQYPTLWSYLRQAEVKGLRDRHLIKNRKLWYRQEIREPARFLCTYMGRGLDDADPFRFILNRSNAIAPNVYLMLYPKTILHGLLEQEPHRDREVFELLQQITSRDLKGEGRVYGGGLHKIEPKELGRISAASFLIRFPAMSGSHAMQLQLLETKLSGSYRPNS